MLSQSFNFKNLHSPVQNPYYLFQNKLHRSVSRHIVPYLGTIVFFWLPVCILEIKEISCLDDFIFCHITAQVSIHGIESNILIPIVHLVMELHALGGIRYLRFGPMRSGSRQLTILAFLAIHKMADIMVGHFLAIMPVVEHCMLAAKDAPVQFRICFLQGGEVAAQLLHRLHHLLLGSHAVSAGLIYQLNILHRLLPFLLLVDSHAMVSVKGASHTKVLLQEQQATLTRRFFTLPRDVVTFVIAVAEKTGMVKS
nr:MAG TPA: hypothetical protein [Caudoviricetes sp.]